MEGKGQQQKLEDGSWKARESPVSAIGAAAAFSMSLAPSQVRQPHPHQTPLFSLEQDSMTSNHSPPGMQPMRGRSLFGTAVLELNHTVGKYSDNKTDKHPQYTLQLQVSSRVSASDPNRSTPLVPFSSNGTRMRLREVSDALHAIVMSIRHVAAASHSDGPYWSLLAVCFLAIMVAAFVCVGAPFFSRSRSFAGQARVQQNAQLRQIRAAAVQESMLHRKPMGSMGHISSGIQSGGCAHGTKPSPSPSPLSMRASFARQESLPARQDSLSPPSAAELTPPQTSQGEPHGFLCKLLVVPPGCESILNVPCNPNNCFHVLDQNGDPVIGVQLKAGKNVLEERRRVEISTREGILVAQCESVPMPDGDEFQLFRSTGEYFAKLIPGDPGELQSVAHVPMALAGPRTAWTVKTPSGSEWCFRGYFERHSMEVTDPLGRVLAMSQPNEADAGDTYLLRVAPLMDVSLVLCSLIAIYHLK